MTNNNEGFSHRDMFAAVALSGLLSLRDGRGSIMNSHDAELSLKFAAIYSFIAADEMMKQRELTNQRKQLEYP